MGTEQLDHSPLSCSSCVLEKGKQVSRTKVLKPFAMPKFKHYINLKPYKKKWKLGYGVPIIAFYYIIDFIIKHD